MPLSPKSGPHDACCGSPPAEKDRAGVNRVMLFLTQFPAVVVSIKLEFYAKWKEVGETHGRVGRERNVTYFAVNKLLLCVPRT